MALLRPADFPARLLLPYVAAQLAGAVLAGATVAVLFGPLLRRFEAAERIVRGAPGSELSAMVFGEYFPNPAMFGTDAAARALVSPWQAALVEGFGTAVLVLVIFALTSSRNADKPGANLTPFFIGFTVAVLISLFAPLTQAGWNPARDFGPAPGGLRAGLGQGGDSRTRRWLLGVRRRAVDRRAAGRSGVASGGWTGGREFNPLNRVAPERCTCIVSR